MIAMDKVHFIRQLYYEQGKDIPAILAVDCQVKLTHFYT